jgi:hypothetical protein
MAARWCLCGRRGKRVYLTASRMGLVGKVEGSADGEVSGGEEEFAGVVEVVVIRGAERR